MGTVGRDEAVYLGQDGYSDHIARAKARSSKPLESRARTTLDSGLNFTLLKGHGHVNGSPLGLSTRLDG